MKNQTMWLLIGGGILFYLMNKPATAAPLARVKFRPYTDANPPRKLHMAGIPGGTGGFAVQDQSFGSGHRSRYGYEG
jgi:hypothetical protein